VVIRRGSENKYQKYVCSREIGLRAKNMIAILDSIVDIALKGLNEHFIEHENLHFDNEEDIHMSSKNYEESGYDLDLGLLVTISYQNGVFHILV
jgi:hypothetical protein